MRGRVVVVSGSTSGIGRAIALGAAAGGARVVVNGRREARCAEVMAKIEKGGGEAVAAVGDAAEAGTVAAMLGAPRERWGVDADCVVVNAGRGLRGSVVDSDVSQWEEVVRTNVLGAALLIRAAGKVLAEGGEGLPPVSEGDWRARGARDVVVIGSNVGKHISPFSSMYGSTKFAVNSLAEAARRELGPKGVRVTLIAPGIVRSEFQEVAEYDPETFGEFMDRIGPVLEPEDVARAVLYVVGQPAHVHVNDVTLRPTRQDYP